MKKVTHSYSLGKILEYVHAKSLHDFQFLHIWRAIFELCNFSRSYEVCKQVSLLTFYSAGIEIMVGVMLESIESF